MKFTNQDGRPVRVTTPQSTGETSPEHTSGVADTPVPQLDAQIATLETTPPTPQESLTTPPSAKEQAPERPREVMSFHGDTTTVDVRKGKPDTREESERIENQNKPKRHGCLFRGCITFLGILVILIGLIVAGLFLIKSKVSQYLGDEPLPIPSVSTDPQTIQEATTAIGYVQGTVAIPEEVKDIVLKKDHINQFIAQYQTTHAIPGSAYVAFPQENSIAVYGSVPLGTYTAGIFTDKWLNIVAQLSGSYHDGIVDAEIVKILLDTHDMTSTYKNLVGTLKINQPTDTETLQRLQRFSRIEANNNQLIFTLP